MCVLGVGGFTAAENHVGIGVVAFCIYTGQQFAGAAGDDFDFNAVLFLKQGDDCVDLCLGSGGVNHQLVRLLRCSGGICSGSICSGSLSAATACQQTDDHGQSDQEGENFACKLHFHLLLFLCFLIIPN